MVNVHEGMVLSQTLFLGGVDVVSCKKALDVDDSGQVGFNDLIHIYQFLFTRGTPPASPFPACGIDPTDDGLSCESQCDGSIEEAARAGGRAASLSFARTRSSNFAPRT